MQGEPLVKGWAESLLWIVESNMLQGGGVRTEFGGVYMMMGTLVLYRRVRDPEVALYATGRTYSVDKVGAA
ncbi:hypothetical protein HBI26_033320 [Parastagonospora nodorum]|nr:hypothetical protein HBI03_108380 [Parastagonospora nodorum]KAH4280891.1 hypothetical protein HBI04_049890 [Parastagonospora nodorum]KAH5384745.1 hypothetical protein HBI33_095550 [Parastagonospora nodorum]KAH5476632.1 hypothetical protein HBI28_082960 [Parastagonospora nodorum]KAH5609223.1 hypothetical protein HBI26_033320 [Parastagonospora nodorum]